MSSQKHDEIVRATYNERWKEWINVYEELARKIADPDYVVRNVTVINQISRAVIAHAYIRETNTKGSKIIDAACGTGFNTCYLNKQGYKAIGFDFSPVAIERARELEASLELKSTAFVNRDHTYMSEIDDESVDAVIAMGFVRYVDDAVRDFFYRNVYRILKKGGSFILTNTNRLFSMFALNNETLQFWADVIEDYSDAGNLLAHTSVLGALRSHITVPQRQYAEHSVSRRTATHEENPFEYGKVVEKYGFNVHKIFYPDAHLLPPFLEQEVDTAALEDMKAKVCLKRADDWRSMFMCYEFLSILVKK